MEPLRLKSRTKYSTSDDISLNRVKSSEETLLDILPVCKRIGVTRISDITFMDRLYLPNYSSVLPGTNDTFWVYGGKGTTKPHAKASALMETIERYSSFYPTNSRGVIQGSHQGLSNNYKRVLHPAEVVEPVNSEQIEDITMDYVPGFDLISNEVILVPAEIVFYRHFPKAPSVSVFSRSHTNGLASGNVLEEAICHALCEVIERDAVSIADLCASHIQYNILEKIAARFREGRNDSSIDCSIFEEKYVDDPSIYPDVDISEIVEEFEPIKSLTQKFSEADIPLSVKNITQGEIGIPTFIASSIEWITGDYGLFAKGYGTHPDSRVALVRAITEVSQTRAANIQGARDDLTKVKYRENDEIYRRKWAFMRSSFSSGSHAGNGRLIKFSEVRTYSTRDVADDIQLIVSRLKVAGIRRAIAVDITNPHVGIPVVRVIVPGLETFEVTASIMGDRAIKHYNRLIRS